MNYIYEFAAVGVVTGIMGIFSNKLKGGIDKAVSFISCLVLMLGILTPLVSLIKKDEFTGVLPDLGATEEYGDEGEYLEKLKELTEERLTLMEEKALKSRFGWNDGDIEVRFMGFIREGQYSLEGIEVGIRSLAALSRRQEIVDYLSEKYLCTVTIKEEIINN